VENSQVVAEARKLVRELEIEEKMANAEINDSALSSVRRLLFGRNHQEAHAHQALTALKKANLNLNQAIRDARYLGESAYSNDWASRNPDKSK